MDTKIMNLYADVRETWRRNPDVRSLPRQVTEFFGRFYRGHVQAAYHERRSDAGWATSAFGGISRVLAHALSSRLLAAELWMRHWPHHADSGYDFCQFSMSTAEPLGFIVIDAPKMIWPIAVNTWPVTAGRRTGHDSACYMQPAIWAGRRFPYFPMSWGRDLPAIITGPSFFASS
jgi:hypothetical protein